MNDAELEIVLDMVETLHRFEMKDPVLEAFRAAIVVLLVDLRDRQKETPDLSDRG